MKQRELTEHRRRCYYHSRLNSVYGEHIVGVSVATIWVRRHKERGDTDYVHALKLQACHGSDSRQVEPC
jgi:hypothetical protein